MESGVGVSWPSGWGRHCCVLAPSSPGLLQRHSGSAPMVLSNSKTDCLVGGPSVQPHALKSKPGKHTTLVHDLSRLPLPPGQNHLSSMERQQEPQPSPTPSTVTHGHRDLPHLTTRKRNSKEATSRGRFVNQPVWGWYGHTCGC